MSDDLFFIPMIAKALREPDPKAAMIDTFEQIRAMGTEPRYQRGYKQLIEFMGLDWEASCMRSHELQRKVKTASYDQVRQPIYQRSAGRWKNYQQHLQPLIDGLKLQE